MTTCTWFPHRLQISLTFPVFFFHFQLVLCFHWAKLYSFCQKRNLPLPNQETMVAIIPQMQLLFCNGGGFLSV